jgi:hypothetical protein
MSLPALATPAPKLRKLSVGYKNPMDDKARAKIVIYGTRGDAKELLTRSGALMGVDRLDRTRIRESYVHMDSTVLRVRGDDAQVQKVVDEALKLPRGADFTMKVVDRRYGFTYRGP